MKCIPQRVKARVYEAHAAWLKPCPPTLSNVLRNLRISLIIHSTATAISTYAKIRADNNQNASVSTPAKATGNQ